MSHARVRLISITGALLLMAPQRALEAQRSPSPEGELVRLRTMEGLDGRASKWTGRITAVDATSLMLESRGDTIRVPLAGLVGVERRVPTRLWGVGAALGLSVAALGNSDTQNGGLSPGLVLAPILGGVAGYFVQMPRWKRAPVGWVRPRALEGTVVRVESSDGSSLTGLLVGETPEALLLQVNGESRALPRAQVRDLAWRSGRAAPSWGPPLLLGLAGGLVGYLVTQEDCSGEFICLSGIGAVPGMGLGLSIGTFVALANRGWRWEHGPAPAGAARRTDLSLRGLPGGRSALVIQRTF